MMRHKLNHKLDLAFWFIVSVLPIFVWFVQAWQNPNFDSFFAFVDSEMAFPFIKNIFDSVSSAAFGTTFPIFGYLSYLVAAEIFHALFDIIVFIPRLAHRFIQWGTEKC